MTDTDAITRTVETYFAGFLGSEADRLAEAFHADAVLLSADGDGLGSLPLAAWLPRVRERLKGGAILAGVGRILSLDVAGDAAAVKATVDLPTHRYVDYLSLLKLGGVWKIVNKIYVTEPR